MRLIERVTIMALVLAVLVLLLDRKRPTKAQPKSPRFAVGFEERLNGHRREIEAETKLAA